MVKKVNLFWLFISLPAFLFSQANDSSVQPIPKTFYYKRVFIGINYGPSLPMASFSGENNEFNNSAFAQRGRSFNFFDFGYRIGTTLGITGYLFNSNNSIDKEALLTRLETPVGINYFNAEAGEYQLRGMMLGLLVSKYGNLFDFDLKFMGGTAKFNVPYLAFDYSETGITGSRRAIYSPTSKRSYGIGLGLGFRIHLNQYVDLTSNANYLIFQNSFTRNIDDHTGSRTEEFQVNHETLNINFGIAYRFLNDITLLDRK